MRETISREKSAFSDGTEERFRERNIGPIKRNPTFWYAVHDLMMGCPLRFFHDGIQSEICGFIAKHVEKKYYSDFLGTYNIGSIDSCEYSDQYAISQWATESILVHTRYWIYWLLRIFRIFRNDGIISNTYGCDEQPNISIALRRHINFCVRRKSYLALCKEILPLILILIALWEDKFLSEELLHSPIF